MVKNRGYVRPESGDEKTHLDTEQFNHIIIDEFSCLVAQRFPVDLRRLTVFVFYLHDKKYVITASDCN